MITKKEIMMRLCEVENNIEWIMSCGDKFDERLKKLESKKGKNETTK